MKESHCNSVSSVVKTWHTDDTDGTDGHRFLSAFIRVNLRSILTANH